MKRFKEDKDETENPFPQNTNGITDPAYMEKLEKLENSDIINNYKEYISDATMTFKHNYIDLENNNHNYSNNYNNSNTHQNKSSINNQLSPKQKSLIWPNTTSEYSEETISNKKEKEKLQRIDEEIVAFDNHNHNNNNNNINFNITTNKNIIVNDTYNKEKKNDLEKEAKMELTITGYVKVKFLLPYVKYEISIYDKEKKVHLKVYRRYCEFDTLRKTLVNKYACVYAPPLPGKILFGFLEKNLLEKRKKFLQIFLHELQYLVYYFYDSPEIQAFLDPNIEYFNPNENLNVTNILSYDIDESLIYLHSFAEISKKTFVNNIQNIHDKIVLKLREQDMSMTDKLTEIVTKNYPRKLILKNRSTIMSFATNLQQNQKQFVNNVFTVLEHIKECTKNYYQSEYKFNECLLCFQNEYLTNLSEGKICLSKYNRNESNNKIKEILHKKPLYVLTKNICDWAYREDNIIHSYCDSFFTLNYFIDKEKEIRREIRLIKLSKNKIKRKDELNKLLKLNHYLNEILILNTIYLHDVRIDRYKYSRFQLYYNAIKFSIEKNKEAITLHNSLYNQITQS